MGTWLCSLALATVVALGGCGDRPAPPPAATGSGSAAAATAATAAPAGGVEIFVNDISVGVVPAAQIASWPRLDTLVPGDARRLGTWEVVSLQGAGAKPTDVPTPSTSYPDMVPAVFPSPGPGGGVAFGMFDPVELAKKGHAALRADNVRAIRIKVKQGGGRGQNDDGGGGGGGDPTTLVLTVKTPAGTTALSGKQLLALPREAMPGSADQLGWRLTALLAAAGVTSYQRLVLTDAAGTNLTLDKKDVSDRSVPFIKLNRQGLLRFRVVKKAGDGWVPGGDLRGLTTIDVR